MSTRRERAPFAEHGSGNGAAPSVRRRRHFRDASIRRRARGATRRARRKGTREARVGKMRTRTLGTTVLPVLAASALAVLALAATAAAQAPDRYDVVLHAGDVMVPMRDGVRLATDVYRPARAGVPVEPAFPVLLQRTPYGKEGRGLVERAAYFVRHGYVVVLQDTRGRYESEGTFSKYHDFDATDGYDTVEWIASLPYTDRRRRHVRHFLRGPHPGRRGQDEPAAPRGPAPQPGRHLRPLAAQGAQPRRVRAGAATRLGLRPASPVARPGRARRLRGRARGRLVRGDAPPARPQPAGHGARVRGLRARPAHPRRPRPARTPTSGTGRASA